MACDTCLGDIIASIGSLAGPDEIPIIGEGIMAAEILGLTTCIPCGVEPGMIVNCLIDRKDDPAPIDVKICECDPSGNLCSPGADHRIGDGH